MNQYLAVDSGGYLFMNSVHTWFSCVFVIFFFYYNCKQLLFTLPNRVLLWTSKESYYIYIDIYYYILCG